MQGNQTERAKQMNEKKIDNYSEKLRNFDLHDGRMTDLVISSANNIERRCVFNVEPVIDENDSADDNEPTEYRLQIQIDHLLHFHTNIPNLAESGFWIVDVEYDEKVTEFSELLLNQQKQAVPKELRSREFSNIISMKMLLNNYGDSLFGEANSSGYIWVVGANVASSSTSLK